MSNEGASLRRVRVALPYHLRNLARVGSEVELEVPEPVTVRTVVDALEDRYPMLQGTIRDHDTKKRRPFLRFFACEEDLSHDSPDSPLPDAVAEGKEPLLIIGAIAGGSNEFEQLDRYVSSECDRLYEGFSPPAETSQSGASSSFSAHSWW